MAELQELLQQTSPPASGEADLDDLRRRVRRRGVRRRVVAAALVVALPLVGVGLAWLRPSVEFFDAPDSHERAVEADAEQASERDIVAEGVDDAGVPWTLAVRRGARGTVCVELDGGVVCGALPAASDEHWTASFGGSSLVDEQRPRRCAAGAVVTDAERVRLDFDDGMSVELTAAATDLDIPARFYGHCWQHAAYVSVTTTWVTPPSTAR